MSSFRAWVPIDLAFLEASVPMMHAVREFGAFTMSAWWPHILAAATRGDRDTVTGPIDVLRLAHVLEVDVADLQVVAMFERFDDLGLLELVDGEFDSVATIRLLDGAGRIPTPDSRGKRHRDAMAAAASEREQETGTDGNENGNGHGNGRPPGVRLYVLHGVQSGRVKIGAAVHVDAMVAKTTASEGEPFVLVADEPTTYAGEKRMQRALKDHHESGKWYRAEALDHPAVRELSERVRTPVRTASEPNREEKTSVEQKNKRSVGSVSGDAPCAPVREAAGPDPLTAPRRRGKLAPNIEAAVERLVEVMPPEDNGRRNFFELAYQGATEADFGDALGAIREVDNVHDRARYAHRTITNRLAQRAAAC